MNTPPADTPDAPHPEAQPDFHSGYVAVAGRPNVGKSTLINAFLGQKIAAVSPRPQTTRRIQLAILTLDHAQVVFMDSPGLHKPRHKLGEFMNQEAAGSLDDADVILFLVDASQTPVDEDRLLAEAIAGLKHPVPVLIGLNKVDLLPPEELPARQVAYQALLPGAPACSLSAATGAGRDELLRALIERLPAGGLLYDPDQITDLYEREIAADLIREAALLHLRDEVPHGVAVRIDEFTERGETGAFIGATLFVERESQKPILIGQGGAMLKKIGSSARQEIEHMSGRKVYLELRVKVNRNWRDNPQELRRLGYLRDKKG